MSVLTDIADGTPIERVRDGQGTETTARISASSADRIRAMQALASVGLAGTIPEDEVRDRLHWTLDAIAAECAPDVASRLATRLRKIWVGGTRG